MDASSSVFIDQGVYPKRNNPSVPAFSGSGNNRNNIDNSNNCFLLRSTSQQFVNIPGVGVGAGAGFLGPRPPVYTSCPLPGPPTYSSLPTSYPLQQPHPPLLPLPLSNSSSLPSPSPSGASRKTGGGAAVRSANKDPRKPKPSPAKPQKDSQTGGTQSQKEPAATIPAARVPKSTTVAYPLKDEPPKDEDQEDDLAGDVYSLSPPPSSLPMPKFSLRARITSSSSACSAGSFGGVFVSGGGDAGASDDLRRLLRL